MNFKKRVFWFFLMSLISVALVVTTFMYLFDLSAFEDLFKVFVVSFIAALIALGFFSFQLKLIFKKITNI